MATSPKPLPSSLPPSMKRNHRSITGHPMENRVHSSSMWCSPSRIGLDQGDVLAQVLAKLQRAQSTPAIVLEHQTSLHYSGCSLTPRSVGRLGCTGDGVALEDSRCTVYVHLRKSSVVATAPLSSHLCSITPPTDDLDGKASICFGSVVLGYNLTYSWYSRKFVLLAYRNGQCDDW